MTFYVYRAENYHNGRTESGRWSTVKFKCSTQYLIEKQHDMATNDDTARFFRTFGPVRRTYDYTFAGYVVTRWTSVCGDERAVSDYTLIRLENAWSNAGARERDVLYNCDFVTFKDDNGHKLFTLHHTDGEHTATYDKTTESWIN